MDALLLVETKQPFKSIKLEKSNGTTCFDDFGVFRNLSRNFWLFSSPLYHICEYCRSILSKKIGSFRTFLFFKNTIVQSNVLKCIHEGIDIREEIDRKSQALNTRMRVPLFTYLRSPINNLSHVIKNVGFM